MQQHHETLEANALQFRAMAKDDVVLVGPVAWYPKHPDRWAFVLAIGAKEPTAAVAHVQILIDCGPRPMTSPCGHGLAVTVVGPDTVTEDEAKTIREAVIKSLRSQFATVTIPADELEMAKLTNELWPSHKATAIIAAMEAERTAMPEETWAHA